MPINHRKSTPIKLPDVRWARSRQERAEAFADHLKQMFTSNEVDSTDSPEDIMATLDQAFQLDLPIKPVTSEEIKFGRKHLGLTLLRKKFYNNCP